MFAALASAGAAPAHADCPVGKTLTVDNGQGGYSETGDSWATWGSSGQATGADYRYLSKYAGAPGAKGKATWKPPVTVGGIYEVTAVFRATENRTDDADYFVHAAGGGIHHVVVDQRDGAHNGESHGPVTAALGSHLFLPGEGHVTLDGTDDSKSDEADAIVWKLVSCADAPPPPPPCTAAGPAVEGYATSVSAAAGWESEAKAEGAPDDALASNPNLESGEKLTAAGFDVCDPEGAETIERVFVGVRSKVQYQSGKYAVVLKLASAGVSATFAHEALSWDEVEVTAAKPAWTFADVEALSATLSLHDHPGGFIDSDVWVDAFRVRIELKTCAPQAQKACMDGQIRWIDSCGAVSRVADACDDGDACTADACIGETCTHAPLGTPECTGGAGCTPQAAKGCHGSAVVWLDSCGAPTDVIESCTDGDPCTEDLCDPATTACAHAPIDAPECAPCAPRASTACGEGGVRWVDGCGAPGDLAVACEDGDPCTTDSCDPATAACVHAWAVGDGCGEPAVCERAPSLVCLSGALVRLDACGRPAGISNGCLDHDPCTTDRCSEETLACVHEPLEPEQCAAGRGGPAPGEPIGDPGGVDAGGSDGSGFSAGTAEPDVQTVSWTEGCAAGGGAAPGLAVGLGVLLAWARRRRGA